MQKLGKSIFFKLGICFLCLFIKVNYNKNMSNIQQEQAFIGSKLKLIPHSTLIYAKQTQLLLQSKRQILRLDIPTQTLANSSLDDEKIVHTAYHHILELYLILAQKQIIAINSEGRLIKKLYNHLLLGAKYFYIIPLEDGYQGVPNNRTDLLLFVKGDQFYTSTVNVYYERQLIKNKGLCDIELNPQPPILHQSPEYIQNSKYVDKQNLLVLWNSNETYVYNVPILLNKQIKRLFIYNRISRRENLSLDYAFSLPLKIMIVGYQSGAIKIYHLDQSRKYIHELRGHQSACVTVLVPLKTPNFLYSGSTDSSVRIWNLQDYQQVYSLQLDLIVNSIIFITEKLLFVSTSEAHGKAYLCQLNTDLLEPIVNQNRGGQLIKLKCDGEWCISIYSNNHVQFFSVINQQRNLSNEKIEYPQKYGSVRDVFTLQSDKYAIALQKGFSLVHFNKRQVSSDNFELKKLVYNQTIVKARQEDQFIELIHEKLLGTYLFNVLQDWKDIPISIKVSYVYFISSKYLPKWDGTTQGKAVQTSQVTYCLLGTSKGQIYFVDIQHRTHYYTKVHFHTSQITFINSITPCSSMENVFLSISQDRTIAIWKMTHENPPCALIMLTYNREFTLRDLFANYLVLGEKTGQFNIIEIKVQKGVTFRKSNNSIGHIRAVICGDYMDYNNNSLFLSGGEDSVIKIWRGVQKQLIFQLKLFGIISAVSFTHFHLDLIVCHNEQISILKGQKLKGLKRMAAILSQPDYIPSNVQQIDIKEFLFKTARTSSPTQRHRLHKLTSKYTNLFHKMTFREQPIEQLPQLKLQAIVSLPPKLNFKAQSMHKLVPRTKRFHINSSYESNQVSLPRIMTKNSTFQKIEPSGKNTEKMQKLSRKDKSFSKAGKNQF